MYVGICKEIKLLEFSTYTLKCSCITTVKKSIGFKLLSCSAF